MKPVEGMTFAKDPNSIYFPARSIGEALGVPVTVNSKTSTVSIGGLTVPIAAQAPNGPELVLLRDLGDSGATVDWAKELGAGHVTFGGKTADLKLGKKRVVVDISTQQLSAYQGDLLVFSSHISTGKIGKSTPTGQYVTGFKSKLHHSSLYNNAPMPWSVQVNGNIFIHGFKSVPSKPASHGCIRMPIRSAKWFFRWVEVGIPVSIEGSWPPESKKISEKG